MKNQHISAFKRPGIMIATMTAITSLLIPSVATAATLRVTVDNLAPQGASFFSRLWVGFHDGNFDTYNLNQPAPSFLERLAEDAITSTTDPYPAPLDRFQGPGDTLASAFANSGHGLVEGAVLGPNGPFLVTFPGNSATRTFTVDGSLASSRYFSYAAMVLPSNDAFFANDDPRENQIFDDQGNFIPTSFVILGNEVLDAGTELNDEVPQNTAALGQAIPNTGVSTQDVIRPHRGFNRGGNILARVPNGDFTTPGYRIARITITQVPESSNMTGLFMAFSVFLLLQRVFSKSANWHRS